MKKTLLTILIVTGVLILALALREAVRILDTNETIQVRRVLPLPPEVENETRKALANPIKRGGVHSVAELLRLINSDPAVAAHYRSQGFRVECASTMVLAANTFARTSYRTPTGFAWTKTPILILAGTDLIVDCEGHLIKMNCANLLQLVGEPLLSADSVLGGILIPPGEDLPFPAADVLLPPDVPLAATPGTGTPSGPWYPPPVLCCFDTTSPPAKTPEPSAFWLMIGGWVVVFGVFRIVRGPRVPRS